MTTINEKRRRGHVAKFRCIECKAEVEVDASEPTKRCPKCFGRYLELVSGEMKRGKSWSAKSFSVK
jgi:DNA-directed RNA polymerase subunit RPC12/RpoP